MVGKGCFGDICGEQNWKKHLPRHHHSAPHAWRISPSQVPGDLGGLVHKGSVPRTPGLFWHHLNLLPPDSGSPLALGAVVADSGCVLAGEPCQLGTLVVVLGNGLLVVSVVIIRTNLLTQSQ